LKKWLPFFMVVVLLISVAMPVATEANSKLDKINKQIEELRKRETEAKRKARQADEQIRKINSTTRTVKREITELHESIEETIKRILVIEQSLNSTRARLDATVVQLVEAEERVEKRDNLLKTRVRLMYENGSVSYLEVLLGSNSFVDFLDRLEALEMIVEQDQVILEANIKDRDMVAQLKAKVESELDRLGTLHVKVEALKSSLIAQEREKEVVIASLQVKKEELEEYKEDEERELIELAAARQKLTAEADKLKWAGGQFAWPVPDSQRITSNYGMRVHPITGKRTGHNGMDIGAPKGTKIVAADDGTVIVAQYLRGYGNTVIINHGSGLWTLYAHMSKTSVKQGASVTKGKTKIGEVGSTGRSTGNHLHFEVRKDEKPVDPMKYLR
jgi:murein DD-endopeptidase MepM/ murein hydrolase activator NlpD